MRVQPKNQLPISAAHILLIRICGFIFSLSARCLGCAWLSLVLVVLGLMPLSFARAASILRVNQDQTKIILQLTPQELAKIELGNLVLLAVGQDGFVSSGRVERINIVQKSAMIVLAEADDRLASKQDVRLLAFFTNPMRAAFLRSIAQYHPYRHPGVETQMGVFATELRQHLSGNMVRTRSLGRIFALQTHLPVYPDTFGLGLGYEHRGITNFIAQTGDDATSNLSFDRAEPGIWFQPESNLRLALRYDFTSLTLASGGGVDSLTYDFVFYQPHLSILWFGQNYEVGLEYRDRDAFTASASNRVRNNAAASQQQRRILPAELDVHGRFAAASGLVWGARLGGVFHERVANSLAYREQKPKLADMLRAAVSMEQRLTHADKLDYELSASGALVPNLATEPRGVHTSGVSMSYYRLLDSGLWFGGLGELAVGRRFDRVSVGEANTASASEEPRRSFGTQFRMQVFARYDLKPKRR